MSNPIIFPTKESENEIKKLMKSNIPMIALRLRVLLECKKHEQTGISKRDIADATGANHNSVTQWRKRYTEGGIEALLTHEKTGFKPSIITPKQKEIIKKKLEDAEHPVRGFKELQDWVEKEFACKVRYSTLWAYVKRNFGAKVKVARKSHIRKDKQAVEAFKKTSVTNAKP
jgi:transposase